jgi:hypothetical protein
MSKTQADNHGPRLEKVPSPGFLGPVRQARRFALIAAILLAASLGFVGGINMAPAQPSPSSPPIATGTAPVQTTATVSKPSSLPAGVYHLTAEEAQALAVVVRFYTAYNAGQLSDVLATLSDGVRLIDCDYRSRMIRTLVGRAAISDYLRGQVAAKDYWSVRYYQDQPEGIQSSTLQVVIQPLSRKSLDLMELGVPGGVKTDFAGLVFSVVVDGRTLRITKLNWGPAETAAVTEARLCSPTS